MKKLLMLFISLYGLFSCTISNPVTYVEIPSTKLTLTSSTPTAPQPPASPVNLMVVSNATQNIISWNPVVDATSYNVYYGTAPGVTKLNGTKLLNVNSNYVHNGLTVMTTYYYVVTSVNANGESSESLENYATPGVINNNNGTVFITSASLVQYVNAFTFYHSFVNKTWALCDQSTTGNMYNVVTNDCTNGLNGSFQYCSADDLSCEFNMKLNGNGNSSMFKTCNDLNLIAFGGKVTWRVPTFAELYSFTDVYKRTQNIFKSIMQDYFWVSDRIDPQVPWMTQISLWIANLGINRNPITATQLGFAHCIAD